MSHDLLAGLGQARLLAIIRGTDAAASVTTALTLIEAGFRFVEISLNTDNALEVIATVSREAPDGAHIGAGTVLTVDDVHRVRDAGATYAVTPAVAESVAESARLGFPVIAGAMTPTECVSAMRQGATAVKLFPASIGGPSYLKALREPLPNTPFIAVGGIGVELVGEYLSVGAIAVGLGSPLTKDAAAGGDLDELRDRARRFHAAVDEWNAR